MAAARPGPRAGGERARGAGRAAAEEDEPRAGGERARGAGRAAAEEDEPRAGGERARGAGRAAAEEDEPRAEGILVGDRALVADGEARRALERRGYGEEEKGGFFLDSSEALYLVYRGSLRLRRRGGRGGEVGFESLMRSCRRRDAEALSRFLIYRDLRSRGYAAKGGFGFGSDFRVYERGRFGEKGARYVVFAMSEGTGERIGELHKKVSQITRMGKEPVMAVIERRGEVIYYRVSKASFPRNREAARREEDEEATAALAPSALPTRTRS